MSYLTSEGQNESLLLKNHAFYSGQLSFIFFVGGSNS